MAWIRTTVLTLANGDTKAYLMDIVPRDLGAISVHDALVPVTSNEVHQPLEILNTSFDEGAGVNVIDLAAPYTGISIEMGTAYVMPIAGAFQEAAKKLNDLHDLYMNPFMREGTVDQKGVVQLYDGDDSTSTELAATANSVHIVSEKIGTGDVSGGTF